MRSLTELRAGVKRIKDEVLSLGDLQQIARDGGVLLAPNLRSARQLRTQLSPSFGDAALLAERVLHWRGWATSLWQQLQLEGKDSRVLLQPLQERVLWEQILSGYRDVAATPALIDLCTSAAALVDRYDATATLLSHAAAPQRDDTVRFARWFRAVEAHCRAEELLRPAALEAALTQHVPVADLSAKLVLCRFREYFPAQQALLDTLRSRGIHVIEELAPIRPGKLKLLQCEDDADEMQALLARLREALVDTERPDIAVVVPDLSTARDGLDRKLREELRTSSAGALEEERTPLWEFSTGRPLAAVTLVADALRLLKWTVEELDVAELSSLLRSPYLDWSIDADTAASLDAARLRRRMNVRGTWSTRAFARLFDEHGGEGRRSFGARAATWKDMPTLRGSFTVLTNRARSILRTFGWPGRRSRTSHEYQAVQRWDALLDSLAALDLVAPSVTWTQFLAKLTAAARDTTFARENTGAPIQFLTPEESTGIQAAELLFLHADEVRWSSRAQPHPLLTWQLQQRHGMPGVDPAADAQQLRKQTDHIAAIAPRATFSYARSGEAGEQRSAGLIGTLPGIKRRDATHAGTLAEVSASVELEDFEDSTPVPASFPEGAPPIRGGVSVLQNQSACAFRAFAVSRLSSAPVETDDLGLDARDRGSVLHRALQIFWHEHKDQRTLLTLILNETLGTAITAAAHAALAEHDDPSSEWSQAYLAVQQTRLERLLRNWLLKEAERPDFRVLATEQDTIARIGPLPLRVRVDRIDEVALPGGSPFRVIVDYKTGEARAAMWSGERPDQPQLPLYATLPADSLSGEEAAAPVGAIAFGVVRPGEDKMRFVMLPEKSALLQAGRVGTKAALGQELEEWHSILNELANDYAAGTAVVNPKNYPDTCKYCDQRLLCRMNPELLETDLEDPVYE